MADLVDTNDDARRANFASAFFYLAGDLLSGVDNEARFDPGMVGSPILGPRTNSPDVLVGANGEVLLRGTSRQVGTQDKTAAAASAGSLTITPSMLLLAGLVFLLLRKG